MVFQFLDPEVSPGFMPRPSLSATKYRNPGWVENYVSPGFMPRPSLSGLERDGSEQPG